MSDNNPAMSGAVQAISLDAVNIGVGSYIINDYLLTVEESEDGNGYTMTIKKGGQSQTIHLTELKQEYVDECIQTALTEAKESGEFDGFTPTVTVTKEADIASITIEDAEGSSTAYIRDGISPHVEVVRNESSTTLYVTDAYGTTESDILDGAKGDKGDKGDTGVSITSAVLNSDYTLTIRFSDGSSYTTPNSIRGPQGIQGVQGPRGIQGLKGDPGDSFALHICTSTEYDPETRVPTIVSPNSSTMYLVPSEEPGGNDLFVEWVYVNRAWEMFGSASIDLSQYAKIDDTAGAGDTDKTWSASKIAADVEAVGDELTTLKTDLNTIKSITDRNLLTGIAFTSGGFIDATDGNIKASTISSTSDFVNVSSCKMIKYKRTKYSVSNPVVGVAFYNESKNYISGVAGVGKQNENGYLPNFCELIVPASAEYARFTAFTDTQLHGDFEAYGVSAISDEFKTLNNGVSTLTNSVHTETTLEPENFFRNTLNAKTGMRGDATYRICSRYIAPDNIRYIKVKTGYRFLIYAYDKDYTYIGIWSGKSFVKGDFDSNWITTGVDISKLPQNYLYRILLATTTNTVFDKSCFECENLLFTFSGVDFVGDQIPVTYDPNSANKLINASGQISSYDGYHFTDLLAIESNKYYHFAFTFNSSTQYSFRIHGYDQNGNWIAQILTESVNKPYNALFIVTSDAIKYIRISLNSSISNPILYPTINLSAAVQKVASKTKLFEKQAIDESLYFINLNHRGYSIVAPENTLPAYALSKRMGFRAVECDLEWTADNVPVLLHDAEINRTARNADGTTLEDTISISDITYEQALEYDFGIWKDEKYRGTKIPTLLEFVQLCKNLGLEFMLDIKNELTDVQIEIIANAINSVGMGEHAMFGTASSSNLQRLGTKFPKALLDFGIVPTHPTDRTISDAIAVCNGLKTAINKVTVSHIYTGLTQTQYDMLTNAGINSIVWRSTTDFTEAQVLSFNKAVIGAFVNGIDAAKIIYDNAMSAYNV